MEEGIKLGSFPSGTCSKIVTTICDKKEKKKNIIKLLYIYTKISIGVCLEIIGYTRTARKLGFSTVTTVFYSRTRLVCTRQRRTYLEK